MAYKKSAISGECLIGELESHKRQIERAKENSIWQYFFGYSNSLVQ